VNVAIITGSCGLVGSEAAKYFAGRGFRIVGIDNDMRAYYFGEAASTEPVRKSLCSRLRNYEHHELDVRDLRGLEEVFQNYNKDIKLVIHAAAQPSHDWAAQEPFTDFTVNANGTLNLLELTRQHCPQAAFIFTSTNKVYGDTPNTLPLEELETRWEIKNAHPFFDGIDESMPIDGSKHSLFGASKAAADLMVQEYGQYFGLKTVCFRAGCLTGPAQAGAQLHGFLSYLMKCTVRGEEYTVFGYKGKQVRDNIHSFDLVTAFDAFYHNPKPGKVYNIGGGRANSCSVLEAIGLCEEIAGKKLKHRYESQPRNGDHIWYVSSLKKFQSQYPHWRPKYTLKATLQEIFQAQKIEQSRLF
jgi:CDP-paratose 2-epimerase